MKSAKRGTPTSADAEVTAITKHGIWLFVGNQEYFMPFEQFPWFSKATVDDICKVETAHGHSLHWPKLDVDVDLDYFAHPEKYPLRSRAGL